MRRRRSPSAFGLVLLLLVAAIFLIGESDLRSQAPGGSASILTIDDVMAVITAAATALDDNTMATAVVDRTGAILGVYSKSGVAPGSSTPDIAVSLARTGAFFSNDQAPLSSRTVRDISGIHFPPNVPNTPNAELYGIENSNRGCALSPREDLLLNTPLDRPRSIRGTFGAGAGTLPSPCQPSDASGCSVGGPIQGEDGAPIASVGITTGKIDLRDRSGLDPSGTDYDGVNPGGIPLYRGGKVIGGVGIAGVSPDRAEYAATRAAAASGRGITTAINAPTELPRPGAVYVDGIRLPFFGSCLTVRCVVDIVTRQLPGTTAGSFLQGTLVIPISAGRQAPEGYLIGPRASTVPNGLTQQDVERIVDQAIETANTTRAVIRLPFGQTTRRPFNREEMRRMYVRDGKVWMVDDQPPGPASGPSRSALDPRRPQPAMAPGHQRER